MKSTMMKKQCRVVLATSLYAMVMAVTTVAAVEPTKGGTLVAMWQLEPQTLYSARGGGSGPLLVNTKIMEKLIRQVSIDRFEPQLAVSWSISSDNRSFTFRLRETNWHDGMPFTSADVQYNLVEVLAKMSSNAMLRSIVKVETPHHFL